MDDTMSSLLGLNRASIEHREFFWGRDAEFGLQQVQEVDGCHIILRAPRQMGKCGILFASSDSALRVWDRPNDTK